MINVKELPPRACEVALTGMIDQSDIEAMKRDLTPFLERDGKLGLVLRIDELDDITGDALIADARFELSMLPQWGKLEKVAVVTDKQAFEALLNWFDPILPMIAFRTFSPIETTEARNWAADLSEGAASDGPGLRIVEDGSDGLLVFEMDGKMTQDGIDSVFEAFDAAVAKHGKINLMVRVKDYAGFELAVLGSKDSLMAKLGAIGKVGRYAVVGAPGWMRAMVQGMGPLIPIEMRTFDDAEDDAAREWARAA